MNLVSALYAIRRFGITGVIEYLGRWGDAVRFRRFLRAHTQSAEPTPGITIIGCIDGVGSLCKVLRDLAILLRKVNIPHQVLNIPCNKPIPACEYQHLVTSEEQFITNKYTQIVTMRQSFPIPDTRCRLSAIEFWEFEDGFKQSQPEVLSIKNLIAMSDFNCQVFKNLLPQANVNKILYPFQFIHGELAPVKATRNKYRIPLNAFMVFFNFDYASSYYRKNPEAILQAFRKAFSESDNAVLVFKTIRAKACKAMSDQLHALAEKLALSSRLITIDDFIPQEDLVNLTNASDAYISLHRGEGFGLGIAEAMTLGKPVIVTDYSATTEFCNAENAMLVPYKMVPVRPDQIDVDPYKYVTSWAEPDIDAAAKALRRLYEDPQLRATLGNNAQAFISNYFSVENFKKSVESFLDS